MKNTLTAEGMLLSRWPDINVGGKEYHAVLDIANAYGNQFKNIAKTASELYVIVGVHDSQLCGIYQNECQAISDCQTINALDDYTCLTLQEHLDNLWAVIQG